MDKLERATPPDGRLYLPAEVFYQQSLSGTRVVSLHFKLG